MKKIIILISALLIAQQPLWAFNILNPFGGSKKVEAKVYDEGVADLTLEEAYRLALKRSEDLAISMESLEEAKGTFYRAFSGVLPKINFLMTDKYQDAPEQSSGDDSFGGTIMRRHTPEKKFTFSQPIFSGFKEIAALQGAGSLKAQRRYEIRQAKEILFINVMESFYTLVQARKDLEILGQIHELLGKRQQELTDREKIGRSRTTEIQSAIADMKIMEAEWEAAKADEILARQLLEFYIGRPVKGGLAVDEKMNTDILDLENYLAKVDARSDVGAARSARDVEAKRLTAAKSEFLPHVSADGNYYTERVGFQEDTDWDVTLSINVPIFEGGENFGNVKEAAARSSQLELTYQKIRRMAELDIKNSVESYQYSLNEEKAYQEANEASKKNYDIQSEEYRLNLVNNLEVLDSLRKYQDVSRSYNNAWAQARQDYWKLKVAVGETPLLMDEVKR